MIKIGLMIVFLLVSFGGFASEVRPISQPLPQPSCQPPVLESRAKIPINCFLSASDEGLSAHQSTLLCTNSKSYDPLRCFNRTLQFLTVDQRVSLCQGASSAAPEECFEESHDLGLSLDERIKLCNSATLIDRTSLTHDSVITNPVHCFRRELDAPLTLDQRVILCATAESDDPVRCFVRTSDIGLTLDQRVRLCTQLTPSSW